MGPRNGQRHNAGHEARTHCIRDLYATAIDRSRRQRERQTQVNPGDLSSGVRIAASLAKARTSILRAKGFMESIHQLNSETNHRQGVCDLSRSRVSSQSYKAKTDYTDPTSWR